MTTPAHAAGAASSPGFTAGASLPRGFVEIVAADRVLGWAWDSSRPEARLRVELRLGEAVLAEGLADVQRDDLAASGIGDGCHAFSLAVPATHRDRGAEFTVVAHGQDGTAALTAGAGTPAAGLGEGLARIERGLNGLVGSQRLIHRNLQAVLMAVRGGGVAPEPAPAAADPSAEVREELRQQIAALEIFVTRLDERMARMAEAPRAEARGDVHALLIAILGIVAGAGLAAAAASLF